MAVDMRWLTPEEIDKAVKLAIQLPGNLLQRQAALLRHLPDPFPQLPVAGQPRHYGQRHAERQHKVHPDAEPGQIPAQGRRMVDSVGVDHGGGGGDHPVSAGLDDAVVLPLR